MKYNVILLAFLALLPFAASRSQAQAQPAPLRSITVIGSASEEFAPDQAILSGQITSRGKDAASAKAENDKLVERVAAVARQFDIPDSKIAAANVMISPEYTFNDTIKKRQLTGYVVSRNLSITIDKLEIHERVLTALVENGIDQISGVDFQIKSLEERTDLLRAAAIKDARQRAEMLAKAAGVGLGRVLTIALEGTAPPVMPMAMMAKAASYEASVAPSLPGMTQVRQSVQVTYELE